MANVRKEGKRMVREKLKQIKFDTKFISEHVESLCAEAEDAGEELLHEKDKHLFLESFHPVMNKLETTARRLFLLKASISEQSGENSSSSSSDSEADEQEKPDRKTEHVKTKDNLSISGTPSSISSDDRTDSKSPGIVPPGGLLETVTEKTQGAITGQTQPTTDAAATTVHTDKHRHESLDRIVKRQDCVVKVKSKGPIVEEVESSEHSVVNKNETCTKDSIKEHSGKENESEGDIGSESLSKDQVPKKTEVEPCSTDTQETSGSNLQNRISDSEANKEEINSTENRYKDPEQNVEDYFLRKRKIGETKVVKSIISSGTDRCTRGGCSSRTPESEGHKPAVTPSSYLPPTPSDGAISEGGTETKGVVNTVTPEEETSALSELKHAPELKHEMPKGNTLEKNEKSALQQSNTVKCHLVKDGKGAPKIRKVKVKSERSLTPVVGEESLKDYVHNYGKGPEVPRLSITDGQTLDVLITEVTSPSLFWVQNVGEAAKLTDLMNDLCAFHNNLPPGHPLVKLKYRPPAGCILAAQFSHDDKWYRARVISRWYKKDKLNAYDKGSHLVDVLYIDYGNKERLSVNRLRPLHPDHAKLPVQAFPCALSEVGPLCSEWTSLLCQKFANFLLTTSDFHAAFTSLPDSPIMFCSLYVPKQDPLPTLSLFPGPQANELVDVGEMLVKEQKQAVQVTNEEIIEAFEEAIQYTDPNPDNPELKCYIRAVEVHTLNCPVITDTTQEPFPSDQVNEADCRQSDSASNVPSHSSQNTRHTPDLKQDQSVTKNTSPLKTEHDSKSESQNTCSPELAEKSCDHDKKRPLEALPRIPQACLTDLSRDNSSTHKGTSQASHGSRSSGKYTEEAGNQSKGREVGTENQTNQTATASRASTGQFSDISEARTSQVKKEEVTSERGAWNQISGEMEMTDDKIGTTGEIIQVPERTECSTSSASMSFPDMSLTVPEHGRLPFVMSFIFDPQCFYIHLVSLDSARTVEELMRELNAYYSSDSTNSLLLKKYISEGPLNPGDIVCARFSEDQQYYRAQVLSVKTVKKTDKTEKDVTRIHVFYVDFGNNEWLPRQQIYPLPPKFAENPPQAVCCTLSGIRQAQAGGEEGVKMEGGEGVKQEGEGVEKKNVKESWDPEMTKEFVKLTGFDKELFGFVVKSREGEVLRPTEKDPLELLVLDTNGLSDVWVNEELHRLGVAHFSPSPEYYEQVKRTCCPPSVEEEAEGWDPMGEAFLSERNSYLIDTDDPGVATAGYSSSEDYEEVLNLVKVTSYVDLWMNHLTKLSIQPKPQGSCRSYTGIIPCRNARSFSAYLERTQNTSYHGKQNAIIIEKILDHDFSPRFKKRQKKLSIHSGSVKYSAKKYRKQAISQPSEKKLESTSEPCLVESKLCVQGIPYSSRHATVDQQDQKVEQAGTISPGKTSKTEAIGNKKDSATGSTARNREKNNNCKKNRSRRTRPRKKKVSEVTATDVINSNHNTGETKRSILKDHSLKCSSATPVVDRIVFDELDTRHPVTRSSVASVVDSILYYNTDLRVAAYPGRSRIDKYRMCGYNKLESKDKGKSKIQMEVSYPGSKEISRSRTQTETKMVVRKKSKVNQLSKLSESSNTGPSKVCLDCSLPIHCKVPSLLSLVFEDKCEEYDTTADNLSRYNSNETHQDKSFYPTPSILSVEDCLGEVLTVKSEPFTTPIQSTYLIVNSSEVSSSNSLVDQSVARYPVVLHETDSTTPCSDVAAETKLLPGYAGKPESMLVPGYAEKPQSTLVPGYAEKPQSMLVPGYAEKTQNLCSDVSEENNQSIPRNPVISNTSFSDSEPESMSGLQTPGVSQNPLSNQRGQHKPLPRYSPPRHQRHHQNRPGSFSSQFQGQDHWNGGYTRFNNTYNHHQYPPPRWHLPEPVNNPLFDRFYQRGGGTNRRGTRQNWTGGFDAGSPEHWNHLRLMWTFMKDTPLRTYGFPNFRFDKGEGQ